MSHSRNDPTPAATLGWALFVATSWTWVIGMFLPVLLIRDFGGWGWIAFAVPNVIGAASIGFWFRTPRQSAAFSVRHQSWVGVFSAVTLALQAFTIGWLATATLGSLVGPAIAATAVVGGWIGSRLRIGWQLGWAGGTWLISFGLGMVLLAGDLLSVPELPATDPRGLAALIGLACACGLGFLLCPYLDVTLHRARQSAGNMGRRIFAVGFGGLFLVMIALTAGYAEILPGLMIADFTGFGRIAAVCIVTHLAVQVAFTNAAHVSALRGFAAAVERPALSPGGSWIIATGLCLLIGIGCGLSLTTVTPGGAVESVRIERLNALGHSPGELIYRSLLACYGLLFPAALLMRGRRLLIALVAAAPFMAVAFLGGPAGWSMAWASAGVAIVAGTAWISRDRS
jgi:hypothetical protein